MAQDNQNFISQIPDLNQWLRFAMANFVADVNCVSIATVDSFDATKQTANLAINFIRVFKGANPNLPNPAPNDQTSDVYLAYPLLVSCPVVVLQGGGGYLTFPIAKGDTGLVFFNDRELNTWLTTGQTTYPHNLRTHDLSDGIFLGGIRPLTNPILNYNTSVASLTDNSGERLNVTGDIKPSMQTSNHSGWLLMNGQTIGKTSGTTSGVQYEALFNLLGGTGWDSGGTVAVPNVQGYTIAGYKSGDPNFGTLGSFIGESTHTLTIPEIPAHSHNYGTRDVFSAGGGINSSGDESYGIATSDTGGDGPHNNIQQTFIANYFIKI